MYHKYGGEPQGDPAVLHTVYMMSICGQPAYVGFSHEVGSFDRRTIMFQLMFLILGTTCAGLRMWAHSIRTNEHYMTVSHFWNIIIRSLPQIWPPVSQIFEYHGIRRTLIIYSLASSWWLHCSIPFRSNREGTFRIQSLELWNIDVPLVANNSLFIG